MPPETASKKPLVVSLGDPKYAGKEYIDSLKQCFDFEACPCGVQQAGDQGSLAWVHPEARPHRWIHHPDGHPGIRTVRRGLTRPLLPHCKIITSASAGYNEFDVDWMTKNNVWFCNTIIAVAEATADLAIFLILALLRDTTRAERAARDGNWKTGLVPSRNPTGMTLGIVGMGSIGKHIARKAAAFNLKIQYHNRRRLPESEEQQYNAEFCPNLHSLWSRSEIVSISTPLNASTTNLISRDEFAVMKDGSYIVNTARGAVIDESALIAALESGKIARAGLDVFCNEPHINPYFQSSEKVILQPHMGGLTDVAFMKSERECFENIKKLLETGRPVAPVNELVRA